MNYISSHCSYQYLLQQDNIHVVSVESVQQDISRMDLPYDRIFSSTYNNVHIDRRFDLVSVA